ncbi:MAG: amino acid adenylation domain-containing protein [Ignavibacteriales bacterium]|nr:MAG: amino acid adenylation domain-containing protein [Ignavibacteriales bacterium]
MSEQNLILEYPELENLKKFNDTICPFRDDITINELFEEYAAVNYDHTAVICDHSKSLFEKNTMSFGELDILSNQLARSLRNNGAGRDKVIGICVERSFDMIVGILGILKSGSAYLPLSPELPEERINYMLSDSNAQILLVQDKTKNKFSFAGTLINLSNTNFYNEDSKKLTVINKPGDLAYVIYTSGSTGRPKGVMIEHRSLINRITWMQKTYTINSDDVILQKTPFYFDVSVWELFWWMITGTKLCFLMPGGEKIPLAIVETIKKHNISTMHFVPSMLNVFLEYLDGKDEVYMQKLKSLKKVFASGEALSPGHVKKFNRVLGKQTGAVLINLYGPTEATVDVSYYNCPVDEKFEKIPIGKPIDNTQFFIINENKLMPAGESGELCISGVCLARGYINNEMLTNERFVLNPFLPGEKMYRTGDIARWLPDGNVEYLGREDHQVKIRGLRIELGEIESIIREYPEIKDCVVIVKQYSENIILIVGYIVPKKDFNSDELKNYLKKYLPDYMIPNNFIELDHIPVLPNGKADRKSLPEPVITLNR